MSRKSSVWLIVFVCVIALAFIASGCAKKQVVKEEAAAKLPPMEAKKEEVKPAVTPEAAKPAVTPEAAKPEAAPKAEAAPPEAAKPEAAPPAAAIAPESIDLSGLRIQFAFDDYSLSNKSKENLEKIGSWMSKNPNAKIQVEGHTCEIGTDEYNLALGERRANSAKKYLEGLGVTPSRMSTISYGKERPLDPGHTEEARSKNRRDEFVQTK